MDGWLILKNGVTRTDGSTGTKQQSLWVRVVYGMVCMRFRAEGKAVHECVI